MGNGRLGAVIGAWMEDSRKRRVVLAAGAALIGLLFFSSLLGRDGAGEEPQEADPAAAEAEYIRQTELRLEELLSGIDGAGRLDVMLTLESGTEYVYQAESRRTMDRTGTSGETTQERQENETTIVMVEGDGGNTQALLRTERPPKIQGVAVICEGAGQAAVERQIVDVLTRTLGISSARVSVAKAAPAE